MKKLALAGAIALVLGGCAIVDKIIETVPGLCAAENTAHAGYMLLVAPRRPADRVAKAVGFHNKVQGLCASGGTLDQIRAAIAAAKAARE